MIRVPKAMLFHEERSTVMQTAALEEGNPADDARAFRRCLAQYATGVTIITTEHDGVMAGVTANSFSSLSLEPPLILWSIARSSRSFGIFSKATHFAVNILRAEQVDVSQRFSSSSTDKFAEVSWRYGQFRSPIIDDAAAVLQCTTDHIYEGGDHIILVGRVHRYARYEGEVLLYAQGRYAISTEHPAMKLDKVSGAKQSPETRIAGLSTRSLLYFAYQYSTAAFEAMRGEEGILHVHGRIMSVIEKSPGISFDDLAKRSYYSILTTQDALDTLIKRGYVIQDIAEGLQLTELGQQTRMSIRAHLANYELELFKDIPMSDLSATRRVLADLVKKLEPEIGEVDRDI